jgi:hypothetical protein
MEVTTYTADIGPVDEDGYQVVIILADDKAVVGRHMLRYDMTRQWVGQELDILNEQAREEAADKARRGRR